MQLWTPEYELEYWAGVNEEDYLESLRRKYEAIGVKSYLPDNPELVVDIGGGRYGGGLHCYKGGKRRVLVDRIDFKIDGIETIQADFSDLPLDDNSVDVLFTWEVYDHADNEEHYFAGLNEAMRVLKGIWFFQHRLRIKPIGGHPTNISANAIRKHIKPIREKLTSSEYHAIIRNIRTS